jgi:hypothetical protein
MGISPFKTRYELLLEKAEIKEIEQVENAYIDYGNALEPKIRDYINSEYKVSYKEDCLINNDIRCNVDGIDKNISSILEIKTTSKIHDDIKEYKVYLVQLLFYMMNYKIDNGLLAIYERPQDFNEEFESERLHIYEININDYKELCEEINVAVDDFRIDLEKIKANPFLTEEDLVPQDLSKIAHEVIALENQLKNYDIIKKQYEDLRTILHEEMTKANKKNWEMPNGTLITNVLDGEDTIKKVFDEKKFKEENQEQYEKYLIDKVTKGKKGYVKITYREKESKGE